MSPVPLWKEPIAYIVLTIIALGSFAIIVQKSVTEIEQSPVHVQPQRATLSGQYVCLPHQETDEPRTLECAFGLQLDDGSYYAINFMLMSQLAPNWKIGDRVTASGVITSPNSFDETLSKKYPIEGIFSITDVPISRPAE